MDIKQTLTDTVKSAKVKGVTFQGGLSLAEDHTLDVELNVKALGNINLPGDSEVTLVAIMQHFGLGNMTKTIGPSNG